MSKPSRAYKPAETQDTVYAWTKSTFPEYDTAKGRATAILEEAVEVALCSGLPAKQVENIVNVSIAKTLAQGPVDPSHWKEELADLLSCVYAAAGQRGETDVHWELDKKMQINRRRPYEYYQNKTMAKKAAGMKIG